MGSYIKRILFATTIFLVSHYISVKLVEFAVWFLDEHQTRRFLNDPKFYTFLYGTLIPYILAAWITLKYIRRVFYIPSIGESIRWVLSFIFFSWGWLLIEYFFDLY